MPCRICKKKLFYTIQYVIDIVANKSAGFDGIAHNSIYRGKYLGTAVTAAQYAAINDGTFEDLYIGDYWTIENMNYRIAAFDYYRNCGDTAFTTHHALIVPEKNFYNAVMNTSNTTATIIIKHLLKHVMEYEIIRHKCYKKA